jgi:L-lactate dehydrogenase
MDNKSRFKVGIVGCGRVGATIAYTLMLDGTVTDLVLFDLDKKRTDGEKLDLEHGLPLLDKVKIEAAKNYKDLKDCGIIIITAGMAQKQGESRLDLVQKNSQIIGDIIKNLNKTNKSAILIMVTNPVDVLTYVANNLTKNKKRNLIFGTGTLLDTLRFRYYLGEKIKVNSKNIHAYVLGEHGDNSFPVCGGAMVGGEKLLNFPGISHRVINEAYIKTRSAAAEIINRKGATYYGIAVTVSKIVEAILSDAKTIFPLSVCLNGEYGVKNVALSVPCQLGMNGIEKILKIELSKKEKEKLMKAASVLKGLISN